MDAFSAGQWDYALDKICLALLGAFMVALVFGYVAKNAASLFGLCHKMRSIKHRLFGLFLLLWQSYGILSFSEILFVRSKSYFVYDIVLGVLGTLTTLSAAYEFQFGNHVKNTNKASGTLEENATVTSSEMFEHSFYQIINLLQIIYLYVVGDHSNVFTPQQRMLAAFLTTSFWLLRNKFPVNHFQHNYNKGQNPFSFISIMYRMKKYQYVFYKHFLLHGLNITVALDGIQIARRNDFRIYWLCLNISYVMEFFLQTMVKKKYMKQSHMINLQRLLMLVSSVSALRVLAFVHIVPSLMSMFLNFARRNHEMTNFVIVLCSSRLIQLRPVLLLPVSLAIICVALLDSIIETLYGNQGEPVRRNKKKAVPKKGGEKIKKS